MRNDGEEGGAYWHLSFVNHPAADSGPDQLQCGVAFGRMFGVEANDMTVCDIELLNGRARQKAASSVAHNWQPPPLEDRETRLEGRSHAF